MEKQSEGNGERDEEGSPDRISELPEPILQHILCFLDQASAAKTSVLSKAWRYLWCARPVIQFVEGYTVAGDQDAFFSVVSRALQGNHGLQEFRLLLDAADNGADEFLNKWLPILIRKNASVTTFDLGFYSNDSRNFDLPSLVFESESIQNLSLRGCALKWTAPGRRCYLKHLRNLSLTSVDISEEIFDSLLSNCPFIEDVSIADMTGLATIKLFNNKQDQQQSTNLKHIDFCNYFNADISVEIDSSIPTLRTILISGGLLSVNRRQVDFSGLTSLNLTRVRLLRPDLFSCISFPCLEFLCLECCHGMEEFNLLCCPSLKDLYITNPSKPFMVTVDAPSIVSFSYEGILPQSISFSAATASHHGWKSNIILTPFRKYYDDESSSCLNELIGLVEALSRSEISLDLDESMLHWLWNRPHIADENSTNIIDVSEDKLPIVVEHLLVEELGLLSSADFLNMLFHMFRPSFIYMDLLKNPMTELHQVAEILLKEREMVQCDFWQRGLDGVSFQAFYPNESEWRSVQYTSLSKKGPVRKLRFRLTWGD